MNPVRFSLRSALSTLCALMLAACCPSLAGCGGETLEEEEPITFIEEGAGTMIPVMLNNKTVRADGFSRRLQIGDISDVKVLDVTKRDENGYKTAHATFIVGNERRYVVEVKVTYKKDITENKEGVQIVTYPVSKVETLSAKPTDDG